MASFVSPLLHVITMDDARVPAEAGTFESGCSPRKTTPPLGGELR
jgi:hypothetical protein